MRYFLLGTSVVLFWGLFVVAVNLIYALETRARLFQLESVKPAALYSPVLVYRLIPLDSPQSTSKNQIAELGSPPQYVEALGNQNWLPDQLVIGGIYTLYQDVHFPELVYPSSPAETLVFGYFFIALAMVFYLSALFILGLSRKPFRQIRQLQKNGVCLTARVTLPFESTYFRMNGEDMVKVRVTPLEWPSDSPMPKQFLSGRIRKSQAEIWKEGSEVPLWVDPKRPVSYWVAVPTP